MFPPGKRGGTRQSENETAQNEHFADPLHGYTPHPEKIFNDPLATAGPLAPPRKHAVNAVNTPYYRGAYEPHTKGMKSTRKRPACRPGVEIGLAWAGSASRQSL